MNGLPENLPSLFAHGASLPIGKPLQPEIRESKYGKKLRVAFNRAPQLVQEQVRSLIAERRTLPIGAGRPRRLLTRKIYDLLHPEQRQRYMEENSERIHANGRKWYLQNTQHSHEKTYRNREKHKHEIEVQIENGIRSTIAHALRKAHAVKSARSFELVGCSWSFLRMWIENQFVDGMSWDRRSEFELDHFVPVSAFNLKDPEEQRAVFHYLNLRPVPKSVNRSKHAALPRPLPSWLPRHIAARILERSHAKAK